MVCGPERRGSAKGCGTDEKGAEDRTEQTDSGTHFCMDAYDRCACSHDHYGRFFDSVCYLLYNHCTQEVHPHSGFHLTSDDYRHAECGR